MRIANATLLVSLILAVPGCSDRGNDRPVADHEEEESRPAGVVTLSPAADSMAAITVVVVSSNERAIATLSVPGRVTADPRREQVISSRLGGRLERLLVAVGTRVAAGDSIAEIFAPEYIAAQEELVLAQRRVQALATTVDSGISRDIAAAAVRRLLQAGADQELIDRLSSDGEVQPFLLVRAPGPGSLVEQGPPVGSAVASGEMLFRLVDLTEIDVMAAVPERSIAALRIGMPGHVVVPALGTASFPGRLERIRDQLDTETRTIDAVLHVPNPGGVLRPGMFAEVVFDLPGADRVALAAIPEAAVLVDGTDRIVFVRVAPLRYERRVIRLAGLPATRDGKVLVSEGISPGDEVVLRGAFTLKSELAKASLAEDHH